MKLLVALPLVLAGLLAGAALPSLPFISNCQVVIRAPNPPGAFTDVQLKTTQNAVTAIVRAGSDNLARLRADKSRYFRDAEGKEIKEVLRKSKTTELTYTWTGDTKIVITGKVNDRPIRPETLTVGKHEQGAPLLSRVGEDYAGAGRSAVRFHLFRKQVQFVLEGTTSSSSQ